MNKKYINRKSVVEAVEPFIGKGVIKVVTGQRRVGKSYILKQIQDRLDGEVIYINKELYEFDFIKTYKDLIEYVEQHVEKKTVALLIDEVQDIEDFEKALVHFHAKEELDLYCAGSNAKLLSGELATLLAGRYVQFTVHSLSYSEFQKFHKGSDFEDYLTFGGMPYLRNLALDKEVAYQYLQNVYESIVLKDVVERYALRNVAFLENLVRYLCNNIGSITSATNIAKFLKSQKTPMHVATVLNYIDALKNCFFIHEVARYDIEGKRVFEMNHKYYIEDIGIRNSIVGYNRPRDEAKLLENLVCIQLKRSGYKVYVGVLGDKEIDFVAEKRNEKLYVQVALHVDDTKTFEREFGNLQLIEDNYPKYVVTKSGGSANTIDGVKHVAIEKFLATI